MTKLIALLALALLAIGCAGQVQSESTGEACGVNGMLVHGDDPPPDSRCGKQAQRKGLPDVWCCELSEPDQATR